MSDLFFLSYLIECQVLLVSAELAGHDELLREAAL